MTTYQAVVHLEGGVGVETSGQQLPCPDSHRSQFRLALVTQLYMLTENWRHAIFNIDGLVRAQITIPVLSVQCGTMI